MKYWKDEKIMIYSYSTPQLDLHGMDREITRILVKEFLMDCLALRYSEVMIIHGIGTGALKGEVHELLKHLKFVENYKLDNINSGVTIVKLKKVDK